MFRALLVEDSTDIAIALQTSLSEDNIAVDMAATIGDAKTFLKNSSYDIIILDVLLPDGDGFSLFSEIRADPRHMDTPSFFLTSRDDISSKIGAFSLGADDYIVKPTNLLEFKARIQSRLKKTKTQKDKANLFLISVFEFNIQSQRLKITATNEIVDLSPREFKILLFLAKKADHILSRVQIIEHIVGANIHVSFRTIDTHVCVIRRKLGKFGNHIESISGEGYRFNPKNKPL